MGIDSATQDDQDQHHDHYNSDQAAAPAAVPAATAIVVVVSAATTAAGRTAEVAVERRHVIPAIIFQWKTCFSCSNPPVYLIQ